MIENRKNSQARIDAVNRYSEKAYDRISIIVKKGEKAKIKEEAEKVNESMNQYINTAIRQRMNTDNTKH